MATIIATESAFSLLAIYLRRHLSLHLIVVGAVLAAVACSIGTRYSMKFLVDAISGGPKMISVVWWALAWFSILVGGDFLLWRLAGWASARVFPRVGADLRLDLFRHLLGHSVEYFSKRLAGSLANRVTTAADAVFTIETMVTWNALPPAAAVLGALVSLVVIQWPVALALMVAVVLIGVFMGWAAIRGGPHHRTYAGKAAEVAGQVVDVVTNHITVRSHGAIHREHRRLDASVTAEVTAHTRALCYMERVRLWHAFLVWGLSAGMLVWAVLLWQVGKITNGDVVVIGSLSLVVLQASRDLAVALVDLTYHWNRLREAVEVLALPHDRFGHSGTPALLCRHSAIEFQRVSFSYAEGQTVLNGLDLRIEAGERVGIVGASGSGKTTLLSLLHNLHAPTCGRILINGQDVTANGTASLHKAIAVVPQDVSLFNRSILENISYGCPNASDTDIMLAARAARCDQFIQELPQGYETIVGERGMRLSGGQRQRLGIARALLVDAPILLLDEATSALDAASEAAIQEALSHLMAGRTVLAATHRLSTIMSFDRVIVLQGGRITEDGTPAELCRADGLFASLWHLQSGNPTRTHHMEHSPIAPLHELADAESSIRRFG